MQSGLIDAITRSRIVCSCAWYVIFVLLILPSWGARRRLQSTWLHITGTRERYILDKSYWLVSSFNGNVVPLNGVRAELKREGKNKGMKYKLDVVGEGRQ